MPERRRIGVFVCHCGGNISDYVDVAEVARQMTGEDGVVVSKTHMFTCSDAAQLEMIEDIETQGLDALVVASCSPKLHKPTFRTMARRAGINPYEYVQVNLREQCSWAHTDDRAKATHKGEALVRSGIAKAALSVPLQPLRVDTVPRVLVIGAGVAGLRSALALADLGLEVHVAEREAAAGGAVRRWAALAPAGQIGADIVAGFVARVEAHPRITLHLGSELAAMTGSIGDFEVALADSAGARSRSTWGPSWWPPVSTTTPRPGEYGYGLDGVVTLPEFHDGADFDGESLTFRGGPVGSVAFIYCVGSRRGGHLPRARTRGAPATAARPQSIWVPESPIKSDAATSSASSTSTATCAPTATVRFCTRRLDAAERCSCDGPPTIRPPSKPRVTPGGAGAGRTQRRRGDRDPCRPGGAGDRDGPAVQRPARGCAQAPHWTRWLLQ